jgi:hypothetical protein
MGGRLVEPSSYIRSALLGQGSQSSSEPQQSGIGFFGLLIDQRPPSTWLELSHGCDADTTQLLDETAQRAAICRLPSENG